MKRFQESNIEPCLFIHHDIICVVYIDDCLFFAHDDSTIELMITDLKKDFALLPGDSVPAFLGIQIKTLLSGKLELLQPHLTKQCLKAMHMDDCNNIKSPATVNALGTDVNGLEHIETWQYASVIGMLMYLTSNTPLDIAFTVHQCAQFTHCAKKSHEDAVKHICHYLHGTKDQGIIFKSTGNLTVECYVDADFASPWTFEVDQDPVCVKSCTRYVLTFGGCPLLWTSKLLTEIALSTMEAEYIDLSQSMRDVIPMKTLVEEALLNLLLILMMSAPILWCLKITMGLLLLPLH